MPDGTVLGNKAEIKFNGDTIGRVRSITASRGFLEVDTATLHSLAKPGESQGDDDPSRHGGVSLGFHQFTGIAPDPEFTVEVVSSSASDETGHNIPGYTDTTGELGPIGKDWGDKPAGVISIDWAGDGTDIEDFKLDDDDPDPDFGLFPTWKLIGYETSGSLDGELVTSYTFKMAVGQ